MTGSPPATSATVLQPPPTAMLSPYFQYSDGQLQAEGISVEELARQHGTPLYIYSRAALEDSYRRYTRALSDYPHMICYSVKANSSRAVLHCLNQLGAGFDVVSSGELERVLAAGGSAARTVFSGVGKTEAELEAALAAGVHSINLESAGELETLAGLVAGSGRTADVAVRVNPDISTGGHPHIATGHSASKFGCNRLEALAICRRIRRLPGLRLHGIACHLGSQIREAAPLLAALEHLLEIVAVLADEGIALQHIDLGGGIGVCGREQQAPDIPALLADIARRLRGSGLHLILEPGRSLAAAAGILAGQVLYLKEDGPRRYAITDIGMNDFLRPALYDAWHPIATVRQQDAAGAMPWDVAGPVCESGDVLGRARALALQPGSFIAVGMAGAYGFSMSSSYNSRPRPAEVMADGGQAYIIRQRESISDLMRGECLPPKNEHCS